MADNFVSQQKKQLTHILKNMDKSALFQHLNLSHLLYENQWNMMYDEFVEHVPLGNITSFLNTLRALTGDIRATDTHVLSYSKIIKNSGDLKVSSYGKKSFPVTKDLLSRSFLVEEMLLRGEILGVDKIKGKIFHIFDDINMQQHRELDVGSFHSLRYPFAPKAIKNKLEPKMEKFFSTGKSRYQKIHTFLTELLKVGKEVEVLIARPQILSEMALILAQREGRHVPLKEICPNLKLFIHYGENIAPYKQSISFFFKDLNSKQMQILSHPSGLLAYQHNIYEKNILTLSAEEGVFYEFIPIEDVKSDGTLKKHYRRRFAGQVKIGQQYVLAVSNEAGLLGFNTEEIVQIQSLNPFTVIYKGKSEHLDYFGEQINPFTMENLIDSINKNLINYNFYIREYLLSDHIEKHQAYWLFELNTDLEFTQDTYLQSAANSIYNEMCLQNSAFRQVQMEGSMPLPQIYFLPVGSISNMPSDEYLGHVDFDETSALALSIIQKVPNHKLFVPVDN